MSADRDKSDMTVGELIVLLIATHDSRLGPQHQYWEFDDTLRELDERFTKYDEMLSRLAVAAGIEP